MYRFLMKGAVGMEAGPEREPWFALLSGLLVMLFATQAVALVGATPGDFSVGADGSASYTIPLTVAPGTAGMQPDLALVYNSRAGDGPLGVGFSLAGLGVVTRCGASVALDGFRGGVQYDEDDRFCLNGERLILVSGTEGAPGAEYRTELESFARITAMGAAGSGPASFKVERFNGTTEFYGTSEDSRIEAVSSETVRVWALERVEDRSSNYMTISYMEDSTLGEFVPQRIDYTGNENASTAPYNKVEFEYEDGVQRRTYYQAGSPYSLYLRLSNIKAHNGADANAILVRDYQLNYDIWIESPSDGDGLFRREVSPSTSRSLLTSLQECGPEGVCLPATEFERARQHVVSHDFYLYPEAYGMGHSVSFHSLPNTSTADGWEAAHPYAPHFIGDINNDGISDLLSLSWKKEEHLVGGRVYCAMGNARGGYWDGSVYEQAGYTELSSPWPDTYSRGGYEVYSFNDFNGDGWIDILVTIYGRPYLYLATGDCTFEKVPSEVANGSFYGFGGSQLDTLRFGDFNGDGLPDVVDWGLTISYSVGDGTFVQGPENSLDGPIDYEHLEVRDGLWISNKEWVVGDVDGDGLDDVVFVDESADHKAILKVYRSRRDGTFHEETSFYTGWDLSQSGFDWWQMGDFNGDGLQDVLRARDGNRDFGSPYVGFRDFYYMALSRGDGTFVDVTRSEYHEALEDVGSYEIVNVMISDINRDGRQDVLPSHAKIGSGVFGNAIRNIPYYTESKLMITSGCTQSQTESRNQLFGVWGCAYLWSDHSFYGLGLGGSSGFSTVLSRGLGSFPDGHVSALAFLSQTDVYFDGSENVEEVSGMIARDTVAFGPPFDAVLAIRDGMGGETRIEYGHLNDPDVYEKGDPVAGGLKRLQTGPAVVKRVTRDDTSGSEYAVDYTYQGLVFDRESQRILGFASMDRTDERTGVREAHFYSQTYPYLGRAEEVHRYSSSGSLLSYVETKWATEQTEAPYYVYPQRVASKAWTLEGAPENGDSIAPDVVLTTLELDDFGNITRERRETDDGYVKETVTVFSNDEARWRIGRPVSRITSLSLDRDCADTAEGPVSLPDIVREESFIYRNTNGYLLEHRLVSREVDSAQIPQSADLWTRFAYDAWGNLTTEHVFGDDIEPRKTRFEYGDESGGSPGQFLSRVTNALGHVAQSEYDPRWGVPVRTVSANNQATTYEYDALGRLEKEVRPDQNETRIVREWCENGCPPRAVYKVSNWVDGAPSQTEYFDRLGRKVRTETESFDGRLSQVDYLYDNLGRVESKSLPHFYAPLYHRYEYDELGRMTLHVAPDGSEVRYGYGARRATVTAPNGVVTEEVLDSVGRTIERHEDHGGDEATTTRYTYGADGNLWIIRDPADNLSLMFYDSFGRKVFYWDGDMGPVHSVYNAVGELVEERNASTWKSWEYDVLGRKVSEASPEGVATWEYDTAQNGVGMLAESVGMNPTIRDAYEYDGLARLSSVARTRSGGLWHTESFTYDGFGRLDETIYPTGRLRVENEYNAFGYLAGIKGYTDGNSAPAIAWQRETVNERGQTTGQSYGNGVTDTQTWNREDGSLESICTSFSSGCSVQDIAYDFDEMRRLTYRRNAHIYPGASSWDTAEILGYDDLNRLTSVTGAGQDLSLEYGLDGNILYKSDVGAYTYGTRSLGSAPGAGAGPHAVVSTSGEVNATYRYDAIGNQVSGRGRTLAYNSYGKLRSAKSGSLTTTYAYTADQTRARTVVSEGGMVTKASDHFGEGFEVIFEGNQVTYRHSVQAAGQSIGELSYHEVAGEPVGWETRYLHTDHLGSTSVVTDEGGTVLERFAYDAFGKLRAMQSPDGGTVLLSDETTRGFTGQRHEAGHGLYDYRARSYDPELGRFLQGDTLIPDLFDPQQLNPYSYVKNSPQVFTDPTGHAPEEITIIGIRGTLFGISGTSGTAGGANASVGGLGGSLTVSYSVNAASFGAAAASMMAILAVEWMKSAAARGDGRGFSTAAALLAKSLSELEGEQKSLTAIVTIDHVLLKPYGTNAKEGGGSEDALGRTQSGMSIMEMYAEMLHVEEAIAVPIIVTATGVAIIVVTTAALVTSPVSVPVAILSAGVLGSTGIMLTWSGVDLGFTQLNSMCGTSLPTSGLLPPIPNVFSGGH